MADEKIMQNIHLLDNNTIDQIAAGEVVERPASIVKELVENAMDSGADAITVEIKGGGIDFIRVTDNGSGIDAVDIPNAFLRHATSKIKSIQDLDQLHSMGFRGEALASIASVCKVRMITKRSGALMGYQYEIEGGVSSPLEEIGAPEGTTVIAAHLFYNTPVRRKFLKSAASEGNTITELMEHLALSRPDISYKYILNGKTRFMTSGSGDLKEVIHRIYGKEAVKTVVPISYEINGLRIDGYLGSPAMNRPNRNFENYFLNRRYIRSELVARGIEEGYKGYTMQHKFPFCVLHLNMDSSEIDVNVHPSKMDVRFHDREGVFASLSRAVAEALHAREMIPESVLEKAPKESGEKSETPEPFETARKEKLLEEEQQKTQEAIITKKSSEESISKEKANNTGKKPAETDVSPVDRNAYYVDRSGQLDKNGAIFDISFDDEDGDHPGKIRDFQAKAPVLTSPAPKPPAPIEDPYKNAVQLEMLPKERVISAKARKQYRLIGCIFNTYWLFSYQEKLYFVDQHAAHEKVNYERLVRQYRNGEVFRQQLAPPIIVSLSPTETDVLKEHREHLENFGFTIEDFGGNEYALTTVPYETYRKEPKTLFLEILNDLSLKGTLGIPNVIDRVLATIACKASVKGGDVISIQEMDAVLDELLGLDNPYHCPHGRPTLFSMSRSELERKFKRIVN